jgi:hypothetical protein
MNAPGIGERLLALEQAVAALQAELSALIAAGSPAPAPAPTALEQMAQQLGNARLAAVLVRAGYTSVEAVAAAPDEALLAVDGVGEKALGAIRARLG